ncbi:hypothetical protein BDR03DRAFT_250773 [Suillus americanus]|nr:hypothetical protein BDR03DRAFT_250773 [Suillus americanus]
MIANTNTIARNTLKEVKLELQQVSRTLQEGNRGVEELKKDSAAQKVREQGEALEICDNSSQTSGVLIFMGRILYQRSSIIWGHDEVHASVVIHLSCWRIPLTFFAVIEIGIALHSFAITTHDYPSVYDSNYMQPLPSTFNNTTARETISHPLYPSDYQITCINTTDG